MEQLYLKTRRQWRTWLARNHARTDGVWLVFDRKGCGTPGMSYGDAVEEALCFGWIDSIIRRLDDQRYARKMSPRKDESRWSEANIRRVGTLRQLGLMAPPGLASVAAAKRAGRWRAAVKPSLPPGMPPELEQALARNRRAREVFDRLAPSYRKQYIGWVAVAKRPDTRLRRARESVRLLGEGRKLGLK